ncbi:MAG: protoheme IX farnesyltransferase [Candidatus Nanopelagicaceae bacterium]|nr:protoheme IX farnesyltransferase [Candidatus Nanopelagicaceae bacterium]
MISPYIALMKLRVVELLLVTTLPALFLAADGVPPLDITLATLIGGTLAAGAANAFNMVIESDIDQLMNRTSKRPIVNNQISENQALGFATAITIISLVIFWFFTNPLATGLTVGAIAFYVFGYTVGLKRRTSQNIVWGGIAGCLPVLIGWAAVTNSLSWTAFWFFMVIFFWTPPHFWALAIKYRDDYEAAGIPMLPVVAPMAKVSQQMWFHTILMVITSFLTIYSADLPSWVWLANALIAGLFVYQVMGLNKGSIDKSAGKIFHGSITYLSLYSVLLVLAIFI